MFVFNQLFQNKTLNILRVILILAGILRIWGLKYGLPLAVHPDEHAIYLNALQMVSRGDMDPHFYNWPAHTILYIDCGIFYIATAVFNLIHETSYLPLQLSATHLTLFIILGRLVTV